MIASGRMAPKRVQRVHQRFALGNAGRLRGDGNCVRAEPLRRNFEAGAGARGRLEEKIHHGAAPQQIEPLETLPGSGLKIAGAIEDGPDLGARQMFRPEKPRHSPHSSLIDSFHEQNLFHFVDFAELHLDDLIRRGLHVTPDIARLDR